MHCYGRLASETFPKIFTLEKRGMHDFESATTLRLKVQDFENGAHPAGGNEPNDAIAACKNRPWCEINPC
jgi:hypothetical protein